MEILLVAAKKDMVETHASLVKDAGFTPVVIDVDSFAIQNAYEMTHEELGNRVAGLINIGSDVTNINIIQNNIPLFTRDVSVGSNVFIEAIQRELGLSFEEAEAMVNGSSAIQDEQKCRKIISRRLRGALGGDQQVDFLLEDGRRRGAARRGDPERRRRPSPRSQGDSEREARDRIQGQRFGEQGRPRRQAGAGGGRRARDGSLRCSPFHSVWH